MGLVGFEAATFNVVPEADAGVEGPCEDEAAVWGEFDGCHRRIVFMDESPQALTGCCIPYAAVVNLLVFAATERERNSH